MPLPPESDPQIQAARIQAAATIAAGILQMPNSALRWQLERKRNPAIGSYFAWASERAVRVLARIEGASTEGTSR